MEALRQAGRQVERRTCRCCDYVGYERCCFATWISTNDVIYTRVTNKHHSYKHSAHVSCSPDGRHLACQVEGAVLAGPEERVYLPDEEIADWRKNMVDVLSDKLSD